MGEINYHVTNIETYPWNGKHQRVIWDLPIDITKGMDRFTYYNHKGEEKCYNDRPRDNSPIDQRWIAFVDREFCLSTIGSEDFNMLLHKVVHKDLTKVLTHCISVYKKVLRKELEFLKFKIPKTEIVDKSPSENPLVTRYKYRV